jgi:hypothetical protein
MTHHSRNVMAKRMHNVVTKKKSSLFVGTIKISKLKVRKQSAPANQRFTSAKGYKRKPKHPKQEEE